jgi:predicted amidohydrolase YtcJ
MRQSLNPAEHIYAAVNRQDYNGKPDGGWQPQERMSIDWAYHSYTTSPTYLNHSDPITGRLLPGYQADLMLLDIHPQEVSKAELHKIRVDATWYSGKKIFDRYN